MNVIAHWSMNDPTTLSKCWDNSGNGHHGAFGLKKPTVVSGSPNGTYAMEWTSAGANVILPIASVEASTKSVSFWIKKNSSISALPMITDSEWHSYVVAGNTVFVDGVQSGSQTISDILTVIDSLLKNGTGFTISDIYFYSDEISQVDIEKILQVKTSILSDGTLKCKEVVEKVTGSSNIQKSGVVSTKTFTAGVQNIDKVSIKKEDIMSSNIVEY